MTYLEKHNNQKDITHTVLCSKYPLFLLWPLNLDRAVSHLTGSCRRKGRVEKVSEKEQQKYNNQLILDFRHPKPRPSCYAWWWRRDNGRQEKETKTRSKTGLSSGTHLLVIISCCCCFCVIIAGKMIGFSKQRHLY